MNLANLNEVISNESKSSNGHEGSEKHSNKSGPFKGARGNTARGLDGKFNTIVDDVAKRAMQDRRNS